MSIFPVSPIEGVLVSTKYPKISFEYNGAATVPVFNIQLTTASDTGYSDPVLDVEITEIISINSNMVIYTSTIALEVNTDYIWRIQETTVGIWSSDQKFTTAKTLIGNKLFPSEDSYVKSLTPTFSWDYTVSDPNYPEFTFVLADDILFNAASILDTQEVFAKHKTGDHVHTCNYTGTALTDDTEYYWRVAVESKHIDYITFTTQIPSEVSLDTLDKIVYNLAELKGKAEDFTFLEQVKFNVLYYRTLFIRRDYERNNILPKAVLQILPKEEIVKVPSTECPDVGDLVLHRTKKKIPTPIRLKSKLAFNFVGDRANRINYGQVDSSQLLYISSDKYTGSLPRFFYRDEFIYFINLDDSNTSVIIEAAFENPEQLEKYIDENNSPVYTSTIKFPISMDMVQQITQSMMSAELKGGTEDDNKLTLEE